MSSSSSTLSRRERERQRRRASMLAAAESVFAEKGYARATLDEVAERAEFGKGTLYNYFEGGKEEMLFAIFDEIYDEIFGIIRETMVVGDDGATCLRTAYRTLVVRAFGYYQEREDLFIILIKEAHRLAFSDDTEKAEYFQRQRERMVGALLPSIEAAMEDGAIRAMPPRAVAHMLLENLDGLVVHRCLAERHTGTAPPSTADECAPTDLLHDADAAADFLTTMLFDGLQS